MYRAVGWGAIDGCELCTTAVRRGGLDWLLYYRCGARGDRPVVIRTTSAVALLVVPAYCTGIRCRESYLLTRAASALAVHYSTSCCTPTAAAPLLPLPLPATTAAPPCHYRCPSSIAAPPSHRFCPLLRPCAREAMLCAQLIQPVDRPTAVVHNSQPVDRPTAVLQQSVDPTAVVHNSRSSPLSHSPLSHSGGTQPSIAPHPTVESQLMIHESIGGGSE